MESDIATKACQEANMTAVRFIVRAADGSIEVQEISPKQIDPVETEELIEESPVDNIISDTQSDCHNYYVRDPTKRPHPTAESGQSPITEEYVRYEALDGVVSELKSYSKCKNRKRPHPSSEYEPFANSITEEYTIHKTPEDVAPEMKPKCKIYYVRKKTIRLHACVECCESFANAYALKCHNGQIHTEKRIHPCLECGLRFETPLQVQDHLVVHSWSRKHTCPICKEGFSNYGHLSEHLKIHYSKKQYACGSCGTEFAYKCNLKRHELKHIVEMKVGQVVTDGQNIEKCASPTVDELKYLKDFTVNIVDKYECYSLRNAIG